MREMQRARRVIHGEPLEQCEVTGIHRASAPYGGAATHHLLELHGSAWSGTSVRVSLVRRHPPPMSQEENHCGTGVYTP